MSPGRDGLHSNRSCRKQEAGRPEVKERSWFPSGIFFLGAGGRKTINDNLPLSFVILIISFLLHDF